MTVRDLLQKLGTEWGRSIDSNVWTRRLHLEIMSLKTGHYHYDRVKGSVPGSANFAGLTDFTSITERPEIPSKPLPSFSSGRFR